MEVCSDRDCAGSGCGLWIFALEGSEPAWVRDRRKQTLGCRKALSCNGNKCARVVFFRCGSGFLVGSAGAEHTGYGQRKSEFRKPGFKHVGIAVPGRSSCHVGDEQHTTEFNSRG